MLEKKGYFLKCYRLSFFAVSLPILIALLIFIVFFVVITLGTFWDIPLPARTIGFLTIILVFLSESIRRYFDETLIISPNIIKYNKGLCSLTKQTIEINPEDIREVKTSQNLLGRIFNFGSLLIDTAGNSNYKIKIHNISDPQKLNDILSLIKVYSLSSTPLNLTRDNNINTYLNKKTMPQQNISKEQIAISSYQVIG